MNKENGMDSQQTIGDRIAADFSANKRYLTGAEQQRLAGMIDEALAEHEHGAAARRHRESLSSTCGVGSHPTGEPGIPPGAGEEPARPTFSPSETGTGDWYCPSCGYLPWSRVTYAKTCDACHSPVVWHEAGINQDTIDAAVNACAGVPTASLTPGCVARLREALEPFALLNSTVDFSRWDAESPIEILTPSTRKTRGSHQLTLAEVIRARAALAACPPAESPPAAPCP